MTGGGGACVTSNEEVLVELHPPSPCGAVTVSATLHMPVSSASNDMLGVL